MNEKDLFKAFNQRGLESALMILNQTLAQKDFSELEKPLQRCEGHFTKLGEGAFLLEEDVCYPAILAMISYCASIKLPYIFVPISDAPVIVPPNCPDTIKWLTEKGKHLRLTGFPAQQPLTTI